MRSQKHKLKEKELLVNIERLEEKDQYAGLTKDEELSLANSRLEIEHILEQKAQGLWVRSRIKQIYQLKQFLSYSYWLGINLVKCGNER